MPAPDVKRVVLTGSDTGLDDNTVRTIGGASGAVGGVSTAYRPALTATANLALIKAGPTRLHRVRGINKAAYDIFIKVFNKATIPALPADAGAVVDVVVLPAGQAFDLVVGMEGIGWSCPLGLGIAITKLPADSDATAILATDIVGLSLAYT